MKLFFIILFLSAISTAAGNVSSTVRSALDPFIQAGEISGAVTLVAKDGKIVSVEAQGIADLASERPMRTDDLFWIASMTKPLAGVAIMMLQEEGKLTVNDLVETHLPEFKDLWRIEEKTKDALSLVRPSRKITLFDLLTHTAGVPSVNEPRSHSTLGELVAQISQQPLLHEPGARWKYSSGGINVLGRVVEVVSGQPIEDFIEKRITRPLGMADTTFFPSKTKLKRVAKSYLKDKDTNELIKAQPHSINGPLPDRKRTVELGGGLYSTAKDMYRFYQMMLNGGIWKGKNRRCRNGIHPGNELGPRLSSRQKTPRRHSDAAIWNIRARRRLRHQQLGRSSKSNDLYSHDSTSRLQERRRFPGPKGFPKRRPQSVDALGRIRRLLRSEYRTLSRRMNQRAKTVVLASKLLDNSVNLAAVGKFDFSARSIRQHLL